jgi:hypothetical protein
VAMEEREIYPGFSSQETGFRRMKAV